MGLIHKTIIGALLLVLGTACGDEEILTGQWEMVRPPESGAALPQDGYNEYLLIPTATGTEELLAKLFIGHFGREFAGVIVLFNTLDLENPYVPGNRYTPCPCAYMQSGYYGDDRGTFVFDLCGQTTVEATFKVRNDEELLMHFRVNPGAQLTESRVRFLLTDEFVDNDDKLCSQ